MRNMAVIGDPGFTLGFQFAGIKKVYEVGKDPSRMFQEALANKELGILITSEALLKQLPEHVLEEAQKSVQPVVVALSNDAGSQDALRKMIQKSIGVDLWASEEQ